MKISKIDAKTLASIVSEKANGLTAHFIGIRDGKTPTARSPLFSGISPEEVVAMWKKELSRNASNFERLAEYEETRWAKFGPQGGYPPLAERMEDLEEYFSPGKKPTISNDELSALVQETREFLFGRSHSIRALTPEQVLQRDIDEDKVNTNSGLPDFSKRSDSEVQMRAVKDAKSGKWKEYPAVLGSRSSRGKPRFIFMAPMSKNIVGKQYVIPIMEAIRRNKVLSFSAWEGFDEVEQAIDKQQLFKLSKRFASIDFRKMDTTMKTWHREVFLQIVEPTFQPKDRKGLREAVMHGATMPVMIAEDKWILGEHGIVSGEEWTNLIESVLAQLFHLWLRRQIKSFIASQLLGDDGAFGIATLDELVRVIVEMGVKFGVVLQEDKQRIDDNTFIYLQRFFDRDILISGTTIVAGSYPTVLALNSAMNPERFHDARKWSGELETLRWIMIAENCKHHPMFHDLIKFFIKGDKYRMGLGIPGFLKKGISKTWEQAKTLKNFVPTYNEASKTRSIEDFDTVKYLRTLT